MKLNDTITLLNEITNITKSLKQQFQVSSDKFLDQRQQIMDQRNIYEITKSKILTQEATIKNQNQIIERLQIENDDLNQKINLFEHELSDKEHLELKLAAKNSESVRLERTMAETLVEKEAMSKKIIVMQNERQALTLNYKELEALFKKLEQERSLEGIEIQGKNSLQERASIEREALKIEIDSLKEEKRNLQEDVKNIKTLIDELKEQLSNNKEFVNSLSIERDDLLKKLHKMREEIKSIQFQRKDSSKRSSLAIQTISPIKEDFVSAFDEDQQIPDLSVFRRDVSKKSSFANSDSPLKKVLIATLEQTVLQNKGHARNSSDNPLIHKKSNPDEFYLNLIKEEDEKTFDEKSMTNRSDLHSVEKEKPSAVKSHIIDEPSSSKLNESSLYLAKNESSGFGPKITNFVDSHENSSSKPRVESSSSKKVTFLNQSKDSPEIKRKASLVELIAIVEKKKMKLDYLTYLNKPPVIKLLQSNNEDVKEGIIYTDNIYIVTEKETRDHVVLLITGKNLYCLTPNKSYKIIRKVPLEQIYRISISQTSAGLCAFHIYKDYDLLIDTYKRLKLVLFLKDVFKTKELKNFALHYEKTFLVKTPGITSSMTVNAYSKFIINNELQSTYKYTHKSGELYLKDWGIFNPWIKYFFVLTDVGLVYFKEAGNVKPLGFIPVLDYFVGNKRDNASSDKFEFKIKFQYSDLAISLAAESELEKLEWVVAIRKVQEKAENLDHQRFKDLQVFQ